MRRETENCLSKARTRKKGNLIRNLGSERVPNGDRTQNKNRAKDGLVLLAHASFGLQHARGNEIWIEASFVG